MGAKTGNTGGSAGRQRLWLILFGALLVLLFLGFAVAQGIGQPSVPDGDAALVEDTPSGEAAITEAEAKRAIAQQIKQAELKKAPEPGSARYEELKTAAMNELLDIIWIEGEAEELNISVTDKQVEEKLDEAKEQNFPTKAAFDEFLETSGFTQKEVERRVRLQELGTRIQEMASIAPQPSNEEIEDFYEAAKANQFTAGPTRDIRIVTNEDKAKAGEALDALEADSTPEGWKKAVQKYSGEPPEENNGGLQEGISEEVLPEPLKADIFQASPGQLLGPIKFQGTFGVIEVVKVNEEKTQTLGEVRSQISTQIAQQAQQAAFSEFLNNYRSKWTARTFCATDFLVERCANYKGNGHPASAPPACYEENPKLEAGQTLECPAPVTQLAPALPGTTTVLKPEGERLPQRPLPEPSAEQELPEGAAPPEGSTGE